MSYFQIELVTPTNVFIWTETSKEKAELMHNALKQTYATRLAHSVNFVEVENFDGEERHRILNFLLYGRKAPKGDRR